MEMKEGYYLNEEVTEMLSQFKDLLRRNYGIESDDATLVSSGACLKVYAVLYFLHRNREKEVLMFSENGTVSFRKPNAAEIAAIEDLMRRAYNYIYNK